MGDTKKLESEITGLKQLLEQVTLRADKAERYIEENYPAITEFNVRKGWHNGAGVSTYKIDIEVYAEDLLKLVHMLTHKTLSDKKWNHINSEIIERLRKEVKEEYNIRD